LPLRASPEERPFAAGSKHENTVRDRSHVCRFDELSIPIALGEYRMNGIDDEP